MADSRISEFDLVTSVAGTEEITCVFENDNRNITPAQILEYVRSTGFSHSPAIINGVDVNSIVFDFNPSTNGTITSNFTTYSGIKLDVDYNDSDSASKLILLGIDSVLNLNSGSGDISYASPVRFKIVQKSGADTSTSINSGLFYTESYDSNSIAVQSLVASSMSYNSDAKTNSIKLIIGTNSFAGSESYGADSIINVTDSIGIDIKSWAYSDNYSGCQTNITNNCGVNIKIGCNNDGSGSTSIANNYGIKIINDVWGELSNGSITNHYGLYLDSFPVATNEWGVYAPSTTAKHHFAGETYVAKLKSGVAVTPVTATASPSATDVGTVYTNENDSDGATITLPTAVAGYQFVAIVQVAQTLTITAGSGDTIRIASLVTSAAGSITSNTIGSTITLTAINATEWIATSVTGIWSV